MFENDAWAHRTLDRGLCCRALDGAPFWKPVAGSDASVPGSPGPEGKCLCKKSGRGQEGGRSDCTKEARNLSTSCLQSDGGHQTQTK